MAEERLIGAIQKAIDRNPLDGEAYYDMVSTYADLFRSGRDDLHEANGAFRAQIAAGMKRAAEEKAYKAADRLNDAYWYSMLLDAPVDFDAYCQYMEKNRDPKKRFYLPRRNVLIHVVDAIQEMMDDKLDILGISLPPGTGKSTLAIFLLTWVAGKWPDEPNLTGSHSNAFIRGVYDECLRMMDPNGEYLWKDVFPDLSVSNTNAKDCRIDVGKRKRFETLEFTSIGSGNAGLYRAGRLLYCDDLVSGLEVSLSHERLDKLWEVYTTDLRQRKIGDHCKELHIATRWSVHDVIGRLERSYEGNERAKFVVIPALNERDESNFDYKYGVGFTTAFYHEQRQIMDEVSWKALYMNEPIEREGLLYHVSDLQRYFELPDREPDGIYAVCDTKDKGADFCAMPVFYQYGDRFYVEDVVFDDSNPDLVEPELVEALLKYKPHTARFESNSAGGKIAQSVQEKVKSRGGRTKILTKYSTANKETRIINDAPYVKEHFLFKDDTVIKNRQYMAFMRQLFSYSMKGRNKHDDACDAVSMMADFVQSFATQKVTVFARPF